MIPDISVVVTLWNPPDRPTMQLVTGNITVTTGATDTHDQEANAVRLAEQMVREAFRRLRVQEQRAFPDG